MQIDSDVLDVLSRSTCRDQQLFLPQGQLERKLYERVNKVLDAMGGKWKGGKVKAHLFEDEVQPLLAEVIATELMPPKNPLAFYETPADLAWRMVSLLVGMPTTVLEPSAGNGAIMQKIRTEFPCETVVHAVELDPKRVKTLREKDPFVTIWETDFLQFSGGPYEAILMNPPFAVARDKKEYLSHIDHAIDLLAPGGQLIGIAPAGLCFNTDRRTTGVRQRIREKGHIEELPRDTFRVAGTSVATVLVTLTK